LQKFEKKSQKKIVLSQSVGESGTEHDTTHTGIKKTDKAVNASKEKIANNEKISDDKK
jgi:hypothetical protein